MSELPIPNHLAEILIPEGETNDQFEVAGNIRCSCGAKVFEIEYVGDDSYFKTEKVIKVKEIDHVYFLIVKAKCLKCGKEHLIFDDDFHGWNGFVCRDGDKAQMPRPAGTLWECPKCQGSGHHVILKISSQGKEDFLEETDGSFLEKDWVEAFDWITIDLKCNQCGHEFVDWISYETM